MRQVPTFTQLLPIGSVVTLLEMGNIILIPILTWLFFSQYLGVLPVETTLAERSMWFGSAVAAIKFGNMLANVLMGVVADAISRKLPFYLAAIGLLIIVLGGLLAGYGQQPVYLVCALWLGNSFIAVKPMGLTYVTDVSNPQSRTLYLSRFQSFVALGAIVAPLLAGLLVNWRVVVYGWIDTSWLLVATLALLAVCIIPSIPPSPVTHQSPVWQQFASLGKRLLQIGRDHKRLVIMMVLLQLGWATYYEFMPVMGAVLFAFTPLQVSLLMALLALWLLLVTAWILPWLRIYYTELKIMRIAYGMIVYGLGIVLVACYGVNTSWGVLLFWSSTFWVAAGDVVLYIGLLTHLTQRIGSADRGRVIGMMHTLIALVWASTALLGGYLMSWQPLGVWVFALTMIIGLGIYYSVTRRRE